MNTEYHVGGLLSARYGTGKNDLSFFKITERTGNKIRLTPLKRAFTVKGNLIPGEVDPNEKPFLRKLISEYGVEKIGPIIIGPLVAGLRPWGYPAKRMTRGGRRIGAGRKKGSGKGRNVVTRGISLTKEEWLRIEEIRGSTGISQFFRKAIFAAEKKLQKPVDE